MKTKAILITLIVMLAITAYVFQSCKKDANNLPPEVPDEDYPIDDSKIFGLEGNLDWGCSDPENDPLTYDLYFGTSSNPELKQPGISDSLYKVGTLIEDTTYYWKIVAKDNKGNVTESPVWDFSTQPNGGYGTMYDERDGQTYITVDIGDQTWMAENLNYETTDSWWYNNDSAFSDIYGRLYTWESALNACPIGWHLPTDDEWKELEMFLGMSQSQADQTEFRGIIEGSKLKSGPLFEMYWYYDGHGFDEVGFAAHPGGYIETWWGGAVTNFHSMGTMGIWWSATEYSSTSAWTRNLWYADCGVCRYHYSKEDGNSVRCVRD